MVERTFWIFRIALNDNLIGDIQFDNESEIKQFKDNYNMLMDDKSNSNKWGCVLLEIVDDEVQDERGV